MKKLNVLCGLNVLFPALYMGIMCIFQFINRWDIGIIITTVFCSLFTFVNIKKFKMAKNIRSIKRIRVIYIDSILMIAGAIILWINLFVPDPFSIENLINGERGFILPFGAWIICSLTLIPTLITNKRILYKE